MVAKDNFPFSGIAFQNHTRRAKRRMLGIQHAKSKKQRHKKYLDLLNITRRAVAYAQKAVHILKPNMDFLPWAYASS
jgi:hypothetical protein